MVLVVGAGWLINMGVDKCIHPDCECLDYCEAEDPFSKTPVRKEEKQDWYDSDEWYYRNLNIGGETKYYE